MNIKYVLDIAYMASYAMCVHSSILPVIQRLILRIKGVKQFVQDWKVKKWNGTKTQTLILHLCVLTTHKIKRGPCKSASNSLDTNCFIRGQSTWVIKTPLLQGSDRIWAIDSKFWSSENGSLKEQMGGYCNMGGRTWAEIFVHPSQALHAETKLLLGARPPTLFLAPIQISIPCSQTAQKQNFKCTGRYIGFKFKACVC